MNRYERLNGLLRALADRGAVDVDELAAEFAVSAATVRRDLDHLADQQLLTRTRGGAVANAVAYDLPLRYKATPDTGAKQRIARAAADLVARLHGDGAVVGLNGGTTTTEVARALATGPLTGLTIVTNALNIANELVVRRDVTIVVTGGVARPQSFELVGSLGLAVLAELSIDVTILGADAVDPDHGASARHEGEAAVNRLLATRAARAVVVAEAAKLTARALTRICAPAEIDTLITDATADPAALDAFRAAGVTVETV